MLIYVEPHNIYFPNNNSFYSNNNGSSFLSENSQDLRSNCSRRKRYEIQDKDAFMLHINILKVIFTIFILFQF